ncbi:MAG: polysaccharide pyruvyl transferase family protein [Methylophilaceae bacterium]|nr:polysaccharide pyruvyl transferase family protein [Methylophilaceae bacterium]
MNIKILSMQRVVNYGSFMQAFALKQVLETFGHRVVFCDFKSGLPRHLGEKVKSERLSEKLMRLPKHIFNLRNFIEKRLFRRKLRKSYMDHAWEKLGINSELNYNYACDVMVIGSDEVFNYTQNHGFGYVPALFGHDIPASSIISYAASAGYATAKDVESDNMVAELSAGLAKFDHLGVRDKNTYEMVASYAQKTPVYVIDPTLLYDFDDVIPPAPIASGYVLIYAYDGRLDAPEDVEKILAFANAKGLRTVSVGFYHEWCDENLVATPFELLSIFRHAAYVVTDTFHGTIFSIKNRKPFVSLVRGENRWGSNSSKLGFLLHQLGLEHRINRDLAQLESHLDTVIDYVQVYELLERLKASSMQFLENALKDAEIKLRNKP